VYEEAQKANSSLLPSVAKDKEESNKEDDVKELSKQVEEKVKV